MKWVGMLVLSFRSVCVCVCVCVCGGGGGGGLNADFSVSLGQDQTTNFSRTESVKFIVSSIELTEV